MNTYDTISLNTLSKLTQLLDYTSSLT